MVDEKKTKRQLVREKNELRSKFNKLQCRSKKMEETLTESERQLTDIINFLPDATFVIDLQGKVIAWNHAIEEMSGIKAEEMLGNGNYEYALPFYGKRRPILIDLVLKKNKDIEQVYSYVVKTHELLISEIMIPRLKGKRVFLWAKAIPLYDIKGNLLGAIESIRDITDYKQAEDTIRKREKELELKNDELEDLNAALRVLLKQRENDKKELTDQILSNIKVLVLPQIEKLKVKLKGRKAISNINLLEANLNEIVSPFVQKLSAKYINLTNREIQIANLIKEEKTTKEIMEILGISEGSVNIHRYSIRKKLNLTKKHNLKAYLSTLS
jgi:PAS domain S-box-containing protein